ncbi:hypothetical protein HELRODRAFT_194436 [Helobdella robusta]|uniref:Uncharacterized protein n=1 Tax=Helobdella robusta TaxID=6412 RepID=T1FW19_HELRO|nr:hypothetical protein HELRODRAFT_194436 [Helobdella robusta]ESN92066.1 hypothetical protein HELRODRAFT_194436 [Helobdella robusta]
MSFDSGSATTSTTTTDSYSDASCSITGGYISIPYTDSSLDGDNHNYNNYIHNYSDDDGDVDGKRPMKSRLVGGSKRVERGKTLQNYKGQLRLDLTVQYGFITMHLIAGRNIYNASKDLPNCYVKMEYILTCSNNNNKLPTTTTSLPPLPPTSSSLRLPSSSSPICRSSVYYSSSRPVFDEKLSIEYPTRDERPANNSNNNNNNRRLYITVWHYSDKTGDEFIGCMSFGFNKEHTNNHLASGWYYILTENIGRLRHVTVVDDGAAIKSYATLYNISKVLLCRNKNGSFGFSIYGSHPVKICRVDPISSANHHGLQRDDMILRIDGVDVTCMQTQQVALTIRNARFYMTAIIRRNPTYQADRNDDRLRNGIVAVWIKNFLSGRIRGSRHGGAKGLPSAPVDFQGVNMVDYGWLDREDDNVKTSTTTATVTGNNDSDNTDKNVIYNKNNNSSKDLDENSRNNYKRKEADDDDDGGDGDDMKGCSNDANVDGGDNDSKKRSDRCRPPFRDVQPILPVYNNKMNNNKTNNNKKINNNNNNQINYISHSNINSDHNIDKPDYINNVSTIEASNVPLRLAGDNMTYVNLPRPHKRHAVAVGASSSLKSRRRHDKPYADNSYEAKRFNHLFAVNNNQKNNNVHNNNNHNNTNYSHNNDDGDSNKSNNNANNNNKVCHFNIEEDDDNDGDDGNDCVRTDYRIYSLTNIYNNENNNNNINNNNIKNNNNNISNNDDDDDGSDNHISGDKYNGGCDDIDNAYDEDNVINRPLDSQSGLEKLGHPDLDLDPIEEISELSERNLAIDSFYSINQNLRSIDSSASGSLDNIYLECLSTLKHLSML